MENSTAVARGRDAFARRAWADAYDALSAADGEADLSADVLEELAVATFMSGRDTEAAGAMARAHRTHLDDGGPRAAARCAFWAGMLAMQRGDAGQAGGWFGRIRTCVEDEPECAEHGFVLIPQALGSLRGGDPQAALTMFQEVTRIADRFAEPDLAAFGRLGQGQSLVAMTDLERGLQLLDEAMVIVRADRVSPISSGIIYCAVIESCQRAYDLRRAQEWTGALSRWCEEQPQAVPYRGQCLIHRSEILQLHGDWSDALDEAERACAWLSDEPGRPAVGAAHYQRAELHRLRGAFDEAEEAYRAATRHGHPVQPGLARLRLAQGDVATASAAVRRALGEGPDAPERVELLAAQAEIALADDDVATARRAADELAGIAGELGASPVLAMAAHVTGAVELVEGDPRASLTSLRGALSAWTDLDAPFETARVRVLRGLACRELGDTDGAELELDTAAGLFADLGAQPELERLRELRDGGAAPRPAGLTDREIEVLRLVATGMSNRQIADELVISEHTVARHVQNIFAKLDVPSRTAAAAFAFEHELV